LVAPPFAVSNDIATINNICPTCILHDMELDIQI
jgi:hypothetical protein